MALYDSGWVPAASGVINASVRTHDYTRLQVVLAASGTQAASAAAMGWTAGERTVIPYYSGAVQYATSPLPSGTYTVSAPSANTSNNYVFGAGLSGATGATSWLGTVPNWLNVSLTPSGTSFARVVVDGK